MKTDKLYLQHILDAIVKIEEYTSGGREGFFDESYWQDAVIRQLEIIGEATKRISDLVRQQYPDIPWRQMAGLRDVLIHNYMGVDLNAVWEITQHDLPDLKIAIQSILEKQH